MPKDLGALSPDERRSLVHSVRLDQTTDAVGKRRLGLLHGVVCHQRLGQDGVAVRKAEVQLAHGMHEGLGDDEAVPMHVHGRPRRRVELAVDADDDVELTVEQLADRPGPVARLHQVVDRDEAHPDLAAAPELEGAVEHPAGLGERLGHVGRTGPLLRRRKDGRDLVAGAHLRTDVVASVRRQVANGVEDVRQLPLRRREVLAERAVRVVDGRVGDGGAVLEPWHADVGRPQRQQSGHPGRRAQGGDGAQRKGGKEVAQDEADGQADEDGGEQGLERAGPGEDLVVLVPEQSGVGDDVAEEDAHAFPRTVKRPDESGSHGEAPDVDEQDPAERAPIQPAFLLGVVDRRFPQRGDGADPHRHDLVAQLVQRLRFDVEDDGADEVEGETEAHRDASRLVGRGRKTDEPATGEELDPLVEESDDEVEHAAADLGGVATPVDEAVVETDALLRALQGFDGDLDLDVPRRAEGVR